MSTIHAAQEQRGAMSLKSWAMLILLGAIWGGSFFFARVAVAEIHPLTLVLFRVAIAAIALNLYLAARGPSIRLALPYAGGFFLLALLNNVIPFSLIFAGQTQLGAGLASVLNATTPFWTALLANMLTADEKLSWNKVAGILLGLAGTAVMIGPGLLRRSRRSGLAEIRADRRVAFLRLRADGRKALEGRSANDSRGRATHRLDDHHGPRGPRS